MRITAAIAAGAVLLLSGLTAQALKSSAKTASKLSANADVVEESGDFCGISNWHPAVEKCELSAVSYWVAEWPASLRVWRLKMHSAENTADRELTDAELNDVSGGGLAELIIAVSHRDEWPQRRHHRTAGESVGDEPSPLIGNVP